MLRPEQAVKELARRREEERLRYFVPNGRQEEFIRKVSDADNNLHILSAGNWLGKTALVINILGNLSWPGMNKEWFKGTLFDNWPYPKRARIVTESKNVEEGGSIDEEINTWWPRGRFSGVKNGKMYISQYKTDTGWVIDKMTYEQEEKEFESVTLGIVIFDEPPPKAILKATRARMKRGGIILISQTPLSDAAYIYEEIVDQPRVTVTYGAMEDNCKEHGVRGVLEHSHIQQALDGMDPDEIEARRDGKPMHFHNAIFGRVFDREVHVIGNDVQPPPGSQFGMTVDPADGKPYAITWWWVDPRDHVVFDYEWPEDDWVKLVKSHPSLPDMKEYLPIFQKYEAGRRMNWRILDRHFGNNRSVRTNRTLQEDWAEPPYNIDFSLSYNMENEVQTGILKVLEYLKFDKTKPLNGMNLPRVYVKERCKNIIKSLEKWARKVDPNTFVAEPDKKSPYKDFCDVVRYTLMEQPEVEIYQPVIERSQGYVLGRT